MSKWAFNLSLPSRAMIIGLPLISLLVSMYFAVNIPLWDDYHLILAFLNELSQLDGFSENLNFIFSPVSNYLFITLKLLVWTDASLFGQINFVHIIIGNNLAHLVIYYLIYKIFCIEPSRIIYFIPIALFLAIPNFEIQNWSAYTAHVFAILFILATIYFLSKQSLGSIWIGLLMATLAVFSAPAGFIAFLAVFPILFYRYSRKFLLIWYGAFLLISLVYLMLILPFGPEINGAISTRPGIFIYLMNIVLFFGSIFKSLYANLHVWGVFLGSAVAALLIIPFIYKYEYLKKHPTIAAGLLLSLLLALVISIMRSRHGLGATTPYRYRLFQILPLVFLYLHLLVNHKNFLQRFFPVIIFLSIIFYGFRMQNNVHSLKTQTSQLESGMLSMQLTKSSEQLSSDNPAFAENVLRESQNKASYDYSMIKIEVEEVVNPRRLKQLQPMQYLIHSEKDLSGYYELKGWAFPSYSPATELDVLLLIKTATGSHYYKTGPFISSSIFMSKSENGFLAILDKADISMPWDQVEIGIALYHPFQGIIAETLVRQDN